MSKITEINECISYAIAKAKADAKLCLLQEPDITAALTLYFLNLIKGIIPNVRFGGCFIHQRPIAKFSDGKGCEVGDFLVLCRRHGNGPEIYNAVLLQLKMANRDHISIPANDVQLRLYTEWPEFGLRGINNSSYNIQPKTITSGAQYCIAREDKASIPLYVATPNHRMKVDGDYTLGRFLWNIINFQSGRQISKESDKNSDEWSKLIWDLLIYTMHAPFTRSNINKKNVPRLSGDFMRFMTDELSSCSDEIIEEYFAIMQKDDFNNVNHDDHYYNDDNEYNGISVMFIDVNVNDESFREQP